VISQGAGVSAANKTSLSVQATNFPADLHLALMWVATDQGERIQPVSAIGTSTGPVAGVPGSPRTSSFTVKLPADCRTFDAAFSISRSRYVTFRARPELVK
jgi:hypothetical protein